MKKICLFFFGTLTLGSLLWSCQKESVETNGNTSNSMEDLLSVSAFSDNVFAQLASDLDALDAFTLLINGRKGGGGPHNGFGFSQCSTVTVDSLSEGEYPRTVTITYSDSCQSHGVVKTGSVIITQTADRSETGSQRIVTFKDFSVNGYAIEGILTYTNNGNGAYAEVLEGGQITTPEGEVINLVMDRTRTQVAGMDTEDRNDDVYETTGTTSLTGTDGTSYTKTITSPLVSSHDCFWLTSGTVETTVGDSTVVIDYGDGECDNIATRTENGETEEITLGFKMGGHR